MPIGLILTTYIQPGDRVLVEQPTYHGALVGDRHRGRATGAGRDDQDGWDLDALQAAVRQLRRAWPT